MYLMGSYEIALVTMGWLRALALLVCVYMLFACSKARRVAVAFSFGACAVVVAATYLFESWDVEVTKIMMGALFVLISIVVARYIHGTDGEYTSNQDKRTPATVRAR